MANSTCARARAFSFFYIFYFYCFVSIRTLNWQAANHKIYDFFSSNHIERNPCIIRFIIIFSFRCILCVGEKNSRFNYSIAWRIRIPCSRKATTNTRQWKLVLSNCVGFEQKHVYSWAAAMQPTRKQTNGKHWKSVFMFFSVVLSVYQIIAFKKEKKENKTTKKLLNAIKLLGNERR